MDIGQIAGLIAAIAFAVLAGFMIYPLIRLGKLFDQVADTVRESGEHAIPALDEGVTTVRQVNRSLEDVNRISAAHRPLRRLPGQARHQDRVRALRAAFHRPVLPRPPDLRPHPEGGMMFRRLFWIAVGACIGLLAAAKAQAYVRAHTPDAARQFVLGPDQDRVAARTLQALVDEFNDTRRRREAELERRYADRARR